MQLTLHQKTALDHFLSEYNNAQSYENILSEVECLTDEVVIWHPFEDYLGEQIVGWIEELKETLEEVFCAKSTVVKN
jgi:archaellum component FlaC